MERNERSVGVYRPANVEERRSSIVVGFGHDAEENDHVHGAIETSPAIVENGTCLPPSPSD